MKLPALRKEMKRRGIGCCVFFGSDPAVRYFSDFNAESALVAITGKDAFLQVSAMEYSRAEGARLRPVAMGTGFFNNIPAERVIGLDFTQVAIGALQLLKKKTSARIVDVSKAIKGLRSTKTEEELRRIAKACRIAEAVFSDVIGEGYHHEADLKARIVRMTYERGGQPSFEPIVASGWHARMPHYEGSGKILSGPLVMDFGVRYKGYCSDLTRTACAGRVSDEQQKAYNLCLSTLAEAKSLIRDGERASAVALMAKRRLGKNLVHGMGHGIGLEVHEAPRLSERSTELLRKGMTLAVEPGFYTRGFGIRIEDDIAVGGRMLSRAPLAMEKIRKA